MSHSMGFATVPNTALAPFASTATASTATVTTTTTKTILETARAALQTVPPNLLQDVTAMYDYAAKQSAKHGTVLASPKQMKPVLGLLLQGIIVSGGLYKLCEYVAHMPAPQGQRARYWRDKVKNTCAWLKRLIVSDDRLRAEIDKAHEQLVAAKEELRIAPQLERNITEELERKEKLEGAYDALYIERNDLFQEVLLAEGKAEALQHELKRSPDELRRHISFLQQQLSQPRPTQRYSQLEAELEEAHQHADGLHCLLENKEVAYENKLTAVKDRINQANVALRLIADELQQASVLAEDRRAQLEDKDEDLQWAQETVMSLQRSLSEQEQATAEANKRADGFQAQLNVSNNSLQCALADAKKLQVRIDEQDQALEQARTLAEDRKKELDEANDLAREERALYAEQEEVIKSDGDRITELEQQLHAEQERRRKLEADLKSSGSTLDQASQVDLTAAARPSTGRASGLDASPAEVISSQSKPHPRAQSAWPSSPLVGVFPLSKSQAKRIERPNDLTMGSHVSQGARGPQSSTPSKKRGLEEQQYNEEEMKRPIKFGASPPAPDNLIPHAADDDAADTDHIKPSRKPPSKLMLGRIPILKPKAAKSAPPPATPARKPAGLNPPSTRPHRGELPHETPSRKSSRATTKPRSYAESALSARSKSPTKIDEEADSDLLDGQEESLSPSKPAARKLSTTASKARAGTQSPRKTDPLKSVKNSAVKKR